MRTPASARPSREDRCRQPGGMATITPAGLRRRRRPPAQHRHAIAEPCVLRRNNLHDAVCLVCEARSRRTVVVAVPAPVLFTPPPSVFHARQPYDHTVPDEQQCAQGRAMSLSLCMHSPQPLRAGVRSLPNAKGGKAPRASYLLCASSLGNVFPISTISPGKRLAQLAEEE